MQLALENKRNTAKKNTFLWIIVCSFFLFVILLLGGGYNNKVKAASREYGIFVGGYRYITVKNENERNNASGMELYMTGTSPYIYFDVGLEAGGLTWGCMKLQVFIAGTSKGTLSMNANHYNFFLNINIQSSGTSSCYKDGDEAVCDFTYSDVLDKEIKIKFSYGLNCGWSNDGKYTFTFKDTKAPPLTTSFTHASSSTVTASSYTPGNWTNQKYVKASLVANDISPITYYYSTSSSPTKESSNVYTSWTKLSNSYQEFTSDGTYTRTYAACDNAKNCSFSSTYTIKKDSTAPVIDSFTVTGNSGAQSGYTNTTKLSYNFSITEKYPSSYYIIRTGGEKIVDLTNFSTTSTISVSGQFTLSGVSSTTLTLYVIDIAGNITTKTFSITIDTTTPTISTFTLKGNSGAQSGYTNTTSLSYTVTASDTNIYQYKIMEGTTTRVSASSLTSGTSKTGTLSISTGTGTKTLTLTVTDKAGNIKTKTYSIVLDTTSPSIGTFTLKGNSDAVCIGSGNCYTKKTSVSYSVKATDTNIYQYKIVEGSTTRVSLSTLTSGTTKTGTLTISSGDGSKTLTLTVTDKAGNSSTSSFIIILDTISPSISTFKIYSSNSFATCDSSSIGGLCYTNTLDNKYTYSYTEVNPYILRITLNGSISIYSSETATTSSSSSFNQSLNSENEFSLYVKDKAGHEVTVYFDLIYDNTPPGIAITLDNYNWSKTKKVTIYAYDEYLNTSYNKKVNYYLSKAENGYGEELISSTESISSYINSCTLDSNYQCVLDYDESYSGVYYLFVSTTIRDKAGNEYNTNQYLTNFYITEKYLVCNSGYLLVKGECLATSLNKYGLSCSTNNVLETATYSAITGLCIVKRSTITSTRCPIGYSTMVIYKNSITCVNDPESLATCSLIVGTNYFIIETQKCGTISSSTNPGTCPSGSSWNSLLKKCVVNGTGGGSSQTCPSGQVWNTSLQKCTTLFDGGNVGADICPSGYVWSGNMCVSTGIGGVPGIGDGGGGLIKPPIENPIHPTSNNISTGLNLEDDNSTQIMPMVSVGDGDKFAVPGYYESIIQFYETYTFVKSYSILIDNENPQIDSVKGKGKAEYSQDGYTNTLDFLLTLVTSDKYSGLASCKISEGSTILYEGECNFTGKSITLVNSSEGKHTLTLVVIDNAGNESSTTYVMNYEYTMPTINVNDTKLSSTTKIDYAVSSTDNKFEVIYKDTYDNVTNILSNIKVYISTTKLNNNEYAGIESSALPTANVRLLVTTKTYYIYLFISKELNNGHDKAGNTIAYSGMTSDSFVLEIEIRTTLGAVSEDMLVLGKNENIADAPGGKKVEANTIATQNLDGDRVVVITLNSATTNTTVINCLNKILVDSNSKLEKFENMGNSNNIYQAINGSAIYYDLIIRREVGNDVIYEIIDKLVIIDNTPRVTGSANAGSTMEVVKGEEIGNLGMSFTSVDGARLESETIITLNGVRVKRVDTSLVGEYEIRQLAKDNKGRSKEIITRIIVKDDNKEVVKEIEMPDIINNEVKVVVPNRVDNEVKVENKKIEINNYEVEMIVNSEVKEKKYRKRKEERVNKEKKLDFKLFSKYFFKVYDG